MAAVSVMAIAVKSGHFPVVHASFGKWRAGQSDAIATASSKVWATNSANAAVHALLTSHRMILFVVPNV